MKVQQLDLNMAWQSPKNIEWYNPNLPPFLIEGFAFFNQDRIYRRLPLKSEPIFCRVNANINELSQDTAGGQLRFSTNSKCLALKVKLNSRCNMCNMTAIGQGGFDAYVKYSGEDFRFNSVTKFDITKDEYTVLLSDSLQCNVFKDIIINFPLYMGVESLLVGLDLSCEVKEIEKHKISGKTVFYGTSITQGGCASRAGMSYPNILGRWLDTQIVNLGFSGNGLGEKEVADIIATMDDVNAVVLDYEANSGTNGLLIKTLANFIDAIRTEKPLTPIIVVSRIPYFGDFYNDDTKKLRNNLREFQFNEVEKRKLNGDKNIYFINGYNLFPQDFFEFTVDGIHPTDLGMYSIAKGMFPTLNEIIK